MKFRVVLASLLTVPTLFAACGDAPETTAPDAGAPAAADASPARPDATPSQLAHVEVRTGAGDVLFHGPDGALVATVHVQAGVAKADVPPGSSATAVGATGHIVIGGRPVQVNDYETATALADGDVIEWTTPALADLPAVAATLPAAPADAPTITAYWCSRSAPATGAVLALDRSGCGARKGGVIVAGGATPRYAIVVPDLGAGALDLSAQKWQPLAGVALTLDPPPAAGRLWLVGSGVMLDGEAVPFAPAVSATTATVTVPMLPDGSIIASLAEGQTRDDATLMRADASPVTFHLTAPPFPEITARHTGDRSLAIDGDFAANRTSTSVTAHLGDDADITTWRLHLRGDDTAFTMPTAGLAPGSLQTIELGWRYFAHDWTWARKLTF